MELQHDVRPPLHHRTAAFTKGLSPWTSHSGTQSIDESALAWAVNGEDDRSVAFAARLMERGINVRIIDKATVLSDQALPRGTVVVTAMDNPKRDDVVALVSAEAKTLGVDLVSVGSGYGAGDLPDWGGAHFRLLSRPQIAILSQQGFSSYDVGSSWWAIDTHLGIRHSQIDTATSRADLRRYNTM